MFVPIKCGDREMRSAGSRLDSRGPAEGVKNDAVAKSLRLVLLKWRVCAIQFSRGNLVFTIFWRLFKNIQFIESFGAN